MYKHLTIALSCTITGWAIAASTDLDKLLRGEAFTDPTYVASMPADWQEQAVQYDRAVKNADLVISLGQQTFPALNATVNQFARQHGLNIVIQSGTCGISAGKLLRKTIDSGTFCCPPGKNDRMPGLEFHTIAISPIAIIVNSKNPLQDISLDQARKVFQGLIRNWPVLLSDKTFSDTLTPVGRLHCKTRPGHWTGLLRNQDLFGPNLIEKGVIPDLIAMVAREKNTISIETPFMVQNYAPPNSVKLLSLNGVSPLQLDKLARAQYPLYRTYSLSTWSNNTVQKKHVLALIRYLEKHIEEHSQQYSMIPASTLRKNGWRFKQDELIAEPDGSKLAQAPML